MLEFKSKEDTARAASPIAALAARRIDEVTRAFAEAGWNWDPDEFGHFVVVEAGDDIRDLGGVGLNPEDGGLLGAIWESCFWHEKHRAWEVLVLFSNDGGMTYFIPDAPWLDPDLRRKLIEEADAWRDGPEAGTDEGAKVPF